jgi:hypothetical protein
MKEMEIVTVLFGLPNERMTEDDLIRTSEVSKINRCKEGEEKMALRRFKQFIQDYEKSVPRRLGLNVLGEETDEPEIADAATVIIGSELSTSERETLSESFVDGIRRMSERGGTIMAIVVALE